MQASFNQIVTGAVRARVDLVADQDTAGGSRMRRPPGYAIGRLGAEIPRRIAVSRCDHFGVATPRAAAGPGVGKFGSPSYGCDSRVTSEDLILCRDSRLWRKNS